MDPIGTSSPPPDFSNVQSSSSSTASQPCPEALDDIGNKAGDLADAMRDWAKGDASGRDVWKAYKDVAKAGGEALDTCVLSDNENEDQELQFIFNTPVFY